MVDSESSRKAEGRSDIRTRPQPYIRHTSNTSAQLSSCRRWFRTVSAMTRPLRLEFPGALYYVTSRGNRRGAIYRDDADRRVWLDILGAVCARHHHVIHSFCQMTNYYHLLIETVEANLAQGMRQLNGIYTQHFNRRHRVVGRLF